MSAAGQPVCVCVCVTSHLLHRRSFLFGRSLEMDGADAGRFLRSVRQTETRLLTRRLINKVLFIHSFNTRSAEQNKTEHQQKQKRIYFLCTAAHFLFALETTGYSRVRGDGRGHHQHMVPLPEEAPQSSVVSSYIQVPNMEALQRPQNRTATSVSQIHANT